MRLRVIQSERVPSSFCCFPASQNVVSSDFAALLQFSVGFDFDQHSFIN